MFGLKKKNILCIDGGGIRGIIPIVILEYLENLLHKQGKKKPLGDYFDLIAGTSTGGMIALALGSERNRSEYEKRKNQKIDTQKNAGNKKPETIIDDLKTFYLNIGPKIFPPSLFTQLRRVQQAFQNRYDASYFQAVLQQFFGNILLPDIHGKVMVPTFDTESMAPIRLRSYHLPAAHNYRVKVWEAARATTAAPTYFRPAQISPDGINKRVLNLIDGAVYANNPSLLALQDLRRLQLDLRKVRIVSIGTGMDVKNFGAKQIKDWGYMEWISPLRGNPLFSMISAAQQGIVDSYLANIKHVEYIRISDRIAPCSNEIDDASDHNLECLIKKAHKITHLFSPQLEKIAKVL